MTHLPLFDDDPPEPEFDRAGAGMDGQGRGLLGRVFGNQGWSPGVVLSVRLGSRTCVIEMTGRRVKEWTQHGQPRGVRPFDRMAPRDPAAKGKDKPPKPNLPQAAGWAAGPS